jgi:hydrogenase-4 component F
VIALYGLIAVPLLGALGAYLHRGRSYRTTWLVGTALIHALLVTVIWRDGGAPPPALGGWLAVDALGLIVLSVVSAVFLVVSLYAVGYLRREDPRGGRVFVSCLLLFLAATSLVAISHHLALLWVGMETSTLAVAPLIFHRHDRRSLEAVWKYLVLSSVGIALALLGTFFLATAQVQAGAAMRPLILGDLVRGGAAGQLDPIWLKAAFVFLLVGYGTKMGLAPMHAWKPDTYGEAPSLVGGLMAGALTSCGFLGIARITQVASAAGLMPFVQPLLIAFGLASLAVAAAFIIGQTDLKRLLAYSSIEHMGVLVLGLGLGGVGAYGSAFHVIGNALTKGVLFLAVGNIVLVTESSAAGSMRGVLRGFPLSGGLLLVGFFAITGSPPSAVFTSEFTIVRAAIGGGHPVIAAMMVVLLVVIFVGVAATVLEMLLGPPSHRSGRESPWMVGGPLALAAAVLVLGVHVPAALRTMLARAAVSLGGVAP